MSGKRILICVVAIAMIVTCIIVFTLASRVAKTDVAIVKWHSGGHPMVMLVKVTDVNGVPIKNVIVDSESDSGRTGNTVPTDQNGIVAFSTSERKLRKLYVNDICVLERKGLFAPSVQNGLAVVIQVLDEPSRT